MDELGAVQLEKMKCTESQNYFIIAVFFFCVWGGREIGNTKWNLQMFS